MILKNMCAPAIIYLIFSITQIIIDTLKSEYNKALVKLMVSAVFTFLLNYLCTLGLGVVSWFIVIIPFILMAFIVGILLFSLGLDPSTGKVRLSSDYSHDMHRHYHEDKKMFI